MNAINWTDEINNAVTVCDTDGIIVYMNQKAIDSFGKNGGEKLIGSNLYDCHPEPAKSILRNLMENQQTNTYFTLKNGVKKLIHQTPVYHQGVFSGMMEISIIIPDDVKTFERKA